MLLLLCANAVFAQDAINSKEKQKEKEQIAKEKAWTEAAQEFAPFRFSFGSDSYLGVYLEEVNAEHMKSLNLREERGAVIMKVTEGSPAEKAGLKENDVIVSFNGRRVDTVKELQRLLGETPSGRTVNFEVVRGGATQTLTATLAKRASSFNGFEGNLAPFKLQEKELQRMEQQLKRSEIDRTKAEELRKRNEELQGQLQRSMPREFGNFYFNSRGMSFWGGSRLGVSVESLTEQLGNYFGVKEGQGVLVTEVQTDSAAAKAGLKAGDIIIEIDNEKIKSTSDLASAVAKKEEGQMVLKVLRNRDEKTFTVTLEKREIRPATRKRAVIYSPVTDVI